MEIFYRLENVFNYYLPSGVSSESHIYIYVFSETFNTVDSVNTLNYQIGNHYRVPIDINTLQGQTIPKYFNFFSLPISTFVYPTDSIYNGLMIVKSANFTTVLPSDISQISDTDVLNDLTIYTNKIFVF